MVTTMLVACLLVLRYSIGFGLYKADQLNSNPTQCGHLDFDYLHPWWTEWNVLPSRGLDIHFPILTS